MFKKLLLSASLLFTTHVAFSQGVAINEDNASADASSILDIKSTTKGLLAPRMSAAQKTAITTPATGLLIYQTDGTAGFYYYNGSAWTFINAAGVSGLNSLSRTSTEPIGANCATSGIKVEYGLDINSNGTLDVGEENAPLTKFVCNGATGASGATGSNGTNGLNSLSRTTVESAGANCTTGGIKVEYGLDANSNGTLDAGEVNALLTKFVCNGATGASGATGANGTNGLNSLSRTTVEAAGANCTTGGVKVEYGLDANSNGTLDAGEINAIFTRYVCNGAAGTTGASGATGANGTNGLNSLARTTVEAAGANCANGGIKVEYGLDTNNNGTLDAGEINAIFTRYVCNGASGATGATGATGAAGQGVPAGGTTGQVLTKINSTDYNTQWATASGGSGITIVNAETTGSATTITKTNSTLATITVPSTGKYLVTVFCNVVYSDVMAMSLTLDQGGVIKVAGSFYDDNTMYANLSMVLDLTSTTSLIVKGKLASWSGATSTTCSVKYSLVKLN